MPLTDLEIKKAKPKKNVWRLRSRTEAVKGLGVTIAPSGTKSFYLGYTSPVSGKKTQIQIGPYPATTLREARSTGMVLRDKITAGIDPKDEVEATKAAGHARRERGTVKELFDVYIEDMELDGKRSAKEVRRIYNKEIDELIGSKFAAEISPDDVLDVLAPIVRRNALVHADNVRAYLRAAFEIGIHAKMTPRWRGKVPEFEIMSNPVDATKRSNKRKAVGQRYLNEEEVRGVWHMKGMSPPTRLAVQMIISTGQRVEEVLHAPWSEFDLVENVWSIPASRRKQTKQVITEPHLVPLTDFHLELLDEIKVAIGHSTWLFPHDDNEQTRKFDGLGQAVSRFCKKNEMPSFSPRDCRRTFKTLGGQIGIDLELRNRLQGHAMTDVGSQHYDRYSYLPEKREAMQRWTDWLRTIVK